MKIGIIKEGKNPPDRRVALTPEQCKKIQSLYSNIEIKVQSSDIRCISDKEYIDAGIIVSSDISDCDLLIGIKEVPINQLITNKTYMFFSHTIKLQNHNRKLLKAIIDKNIKLIDYEVLTDINGKRLIGFGKYAGIVGAYNGFRGLGLKLGLYDIRPAFEINTRVGINQEMEKVKLPNNFKIAMTGDGRVTSGALEVLETLKIKKVKPDEFLNNTFNEPVYVALRSKDFYRSINGEWETQDFYNNPHKYKSHFLSFGELADMYIACHYWNPKADVLLSKNDFSSPDFKIKMIADISCDINGPIYSTLRSSTIEEPFYGYDSTSGTETDFFAENSVGVMAVDNLPCELPKDASEDFGEEFINCILPNLAGVDTDNIIERATITENAQLTERYKYLQVMLED